MSHVPRITPCRITASLAKSEHDGKKRQEPAKKGEISNLRLRDNKTPGTIAGEGASFFLLNREASPQNYARIAGLATRFNPGLKPQASSFIEEYLSANNLGKSDIDLVILGINGDPDNDAIYNPVRNYFGENTTQAWYKHLCGEHYLASSFALWLGARIMKSRQVPEITLLTGYEIPAQSTISSFTIITITFIIPSSC